MIDNFENLTRSHYCGALSLAQLGQEVRIMGWVHKRRDLGGLIFIDLRDVQGLVQVIIPPENQSAFFKAEKVRNEYVIAVRGMVQARSAANINKNLATGEVEVLVSELYVLNDTPPLPIQINDLALADEDLRLTYRYLDLRREKLQSIIRMRHQITKAIREYLNERDFYEIETPVLVKSTPEGARDYLVPSRIQPGKFYALPQSPQMLKQLLMIAGFDRYYQIARCFRDEDLRADRQPEFTQIDIELSFVSQEQIFELLEGMMAHLFREVLHLELPTPFPRLSYYDAMNRFGCDKPDLRFALELCELSDVFKNSQFQVFSSALTNGGVIKGLVIPQAGVFSRKQLDELVGLARHVGGKGLAFVKVQGGSLEAGISKFLSPEESQALLNRCQARDGDLVAIAADSFEMACKILSAIRIEAASRLKLIPEDTFSFVWITSFPLFSFNSEHKRWEPAHHMFTLPKNEHIPWLDDPAKTGDIQGQLYDLVCNGMELSSGSIRCHRYDLQKKIFDILGFSAEELQERFGFFLEALKYGAPPHGGIAPGLDRIVMIMSKADSIRDVIAFPKTLKATDLMLNAPDHVSEEQWRELNLKPIK
ncbi:MAG: aspartate--tRNA ligase [Candidatus Cloacimonetes bacterium]|nr:aspartate--tRNA ligase [Candidatus Cloacimonadota bacterium]